MMIDDSYVAPIGAIAVFTACALSGWVVSRRMVFSEGGKSIPSLDALRGVLAVLVFIHHSMLWFHWLHDGVWGAGETSVFTNLGKRSVAIFFMVTALLFVRKIATIGEGDGPWIRLMVGRIYRIAPLYFAQILAVVLIVMCGTKCQPVESAGAILRELASWLFFVIPGSPDINRFQDTWLITAGVGWSLAYEWLFYAGLPVMALLFRRRVPKKVLFISLGLTGIIMVLLHPVLPALVAFGGGLICYFTEKSAVIRRFARSRGGSIATVLCMVSTYSCFPVALRALPLICATATFCLICSGSDMFGILRSRALRALGELSYAIYLFHGVFLYILLKISGVGAFIRSAGWHWAAIVMMAPLLVLTCKILNLFVERKAMRMNPFALRPATGGDAPEARPLLPETK